MNNNQHVRPVPKIEYAQDETVKHLFSLGKYNEVMWGCYGISTTPMATFGATSCSIIAMKNGGLERGLLHIPACRLEFIVARIGAMARQIGRNENLKALLIAGETPEVFEEILANGNIPYETIYVPGESRDAIVIPSEQKLVVYSNNYCLERLF